ncbi:MAG: relaxase, partial [Pseudomonadota bacterium]
RSDSLAGFKSALEEHGYYLAKGDRRGVVATDIQGEVFSVARWAGVKTKDLTARIGKGDNLPSVAAVQADLGKRVTKQLRQFIVDDRKAKQEELKPYRDELKAIVLRQRKERERLTQAQAERWKKETNERAGKFRRGLGIVLDVLSGHLFRQRRQNEAEAYAAFVRDRTQRETLFSDQADERRPIQKQIQARLARQREERRALAVRLAVVLNRVNLPDPEPQRQRNRDHDLSL